MSETTMTTAATPIIIPKSVSAERSLCAQMAAAASFSVSMNFMLRVYYGLAAEVPQSLHHADDAEGGAVNLYLLAERVFVGKERAHHVLREHGDVLAPRHIRLGDETAALDVLRERVLV